MKSFLLSKKIYFITSALIVIFIITLFSLKNTPGASAQGLYNHLSGSAFAENIGDIDLDGVAIQPTSGNFTGYGWNENIGWIRFGGLTTPTIAGTSSGNAKYNFSTGNVSGWARACSVLASTDCSGTSLKNNILRGGWDGWISLRNIPIQSGGGKPAAVAYAQGTPTYGVSFGKIDGTGSGYAWGGGTSANNDPKAAIIGWVNFSDVTLNMDPIVTLSANRKVIPWDTSDPTNPKLPDSADITLTWTSANATSCSSSWNGSKQPNVTDSDIDTIQPPQVGVTYTYSLTCYGIGNGSKTAIARVTVAAKPPTIIPLGSAEFEEF